MATYDQEIVCDITSLDMFEPEDDSVSCNMFSIDIVANFMPQIDESDFEEDESEHYNLECDDVMEETFRIEREKLFSEETSETIREILVSMNIPNESFLIDNILNYASHVGRCKSYMNRRVLYMRVEIYLPPGFAASMDDIDMDMDVDDGDDFASRLVPASKESIEALEKVRVEDSVNCTICLEEVLVGSEATRMPCLHLFHSMCVVNWLNKCRACPLCRSEIK